MARGRMINKRISISKKLANLKTDSARLLYFMCYPHTDIKGRLEADAPYIRSVCIPRLNWSDKKINACLEDLYRVHLILLYELNSNTYMEFTRFKEFQTLREDRESKSEIPDPPAELPTNSHHTPAQVKLSKVNISKDKISKVNSQVEEIINYLNKKSKKNFRSTTVKTISLIKVRLKEKFTIDDFKKVIDVKTEQWLNNKEFEGFLRPETLFGNKFEGYLNEHKERKIKKVVKKKEEDEDEFVPMPEHFKKIFKKGIKKIEDKKKVFDG